MTGQGIGLETAVGRAASPRIEWVNPVVARRRAAAGMRGMRLAAGMSLAEVGARLDLTRSSLNRLETGRTRASVHVARSMMDVYDQYVPELLDVIRATRQVGWWQRYRVRDPDYLGWEAGAVRVREVAVVRVPDLLQTPDHTRCLLAGTDCSLPDELDTRRIRQRRLREPGEPLAYSVLLHESALRQHVGGAAVLSAQLAHLAECSALAGVSVRIVPGTARAVQTTGFRLLEFDHPGDPPILDVDRLHVTVRDDRPDAVSSARRLLAQLEAVALSEQDTVDHCLRWARELAGEPCRS